MFTVKAYGDDLCFQWQKDDMDLDDGNGICGTSSEMLRIIELKAGHIGNYACLVKNADGKQLSAKALLTVSKLVTACSVSCVEWLEALSTITTA